jgi:hypothetical protein
VTGWDVLTCRASVPAGMLAELAALRVALPGYDVIVTSHRSRYRYEAIRRSDGPGPWCVISGDPADLWRELAGRAPPAATDGNGADRAPRSAPATIGCHPLTASPRVLPSPARGEIRMPAAPSHVPVPPATPIRAIVAAVVNPHTFAASAGPAPLRPAGRMAGGGGLLARPASVAAVAR